MNINDGSALHPLKENYMKQRYKKYVEKQYVLSLFFDKFIYNNKDNKKKIYKGKN